MAGVASFRLTESGNSTIDHSASSRLDGSLSGAQIKWLTKRGPTSVPGTRRVRCEVFSIRALSDDAGVRIDLSLL
jgi:hypothetical protein